MIKKTIQVEHDISDEVIVKILSQKGIVSMIGIAPNNRIQYQIEYCGNGIPKNCWVDGFEIEKPKDGLIGFVKDKREI